MTDDLTVDDSPTAEDGSNSALPLSDSVAFELTSEGGLAGVVPDFGEAPAELAPEDPVEDELVENEGPSQRLVLNTEAAWTAQSQHGVVLNHQIPSQDYAAMDSPEFQQSDDAPAGQDW